MHKRVNPFNADIDTWCIEQDIDELKEMTTDKKLLNTIDRLERDFTQFFEVTQTHADMLDDIYCTIYDKI